MIKYILMKVRIILKCVNRHYEYDSKALNYWQAELIHVQQYKTKNIYIYIFVKPMGSRVMNIHAIEFKLKI